MKSLQLIVRCACVLALASMLGCTESSNDGNQGLRAGSGGDASPSAMEPPGETPDDGDTESVGGTGGAAGVGGMAGFGLPGSVGGFGGAAGMSAASTGGSGSFPGASAGAGGAGGGADVSGEASAGPGSGAVNTPQPGTLTAGTWDDNRNFERFRDYRSEFLQNDAILGALPTSDADHATAHARFEQLGAARTQLDIALVIDTTGSMSDEIAYLQSELSSISQSIESSYPDAEQRWSLIVYRDEGDDYVVRTFEAPTADVDGLRASLVAQMAGGGGDTPEAPDAALIATNGLAWRTGDDVARLAFWVADAPHHDSQADELADAILDAQALGVHIYPVASSGIDELTELTMRSAAQLTGGRYLFLTSDSGVGGEHKEPTIPCYFVTKLDDAIVRMVDIEMSGEYREPGEAEIVRTGGDPADGACALEGGDEAIIF